MRSMDKVIFSFDNDTEREYLTVKQFKLFCRIYPDYNKDIRTLICLIQCYV